MGETASPGNDVNAEIDQMAIKVIRGVVPRPVCILICLFVKSLGLKKTILSV